MTDHPLDPDREEEVRRLLAAARHDAPMPPEVADRLDGVLADLAAEPGRQAPVTSLHARRRRVASLLVAAAAVVVVGIGVDRLLAPMVGPTSQSESATADRQGSSDAEGSAGGDALGEAEKGPASGRAPQPRDGRDLVRLRPHRLADDVVEVRATAAQADDAGRSVAGALSAACRTAAWGSGTFVPVRYGSLPAVLVLRRVSGDEQVAEVYLCGDVEPVRSVTLPAP